MAIGRSLCQTRLSAERPRLGRYAPAHRRTVHQRRQAGGALDRGRNAGKSDHADVGRLSDLGAAGPRRSLADRGSSAAPTRYRPICNSKQATAFNRSNFLTQLFSWHKQRLLPMGWRLRKSDSLGKLRQRERFSFRNSKYSAGDQFECFSNGRLDLLLRCGREPAREEKPLDDLGLVNDRPGEYRDGELVGFGLAMRRERTVDNHFSTGRERTRYVGADLTGHAINCF